MSEFWVEVYEGVGKVRRVPVVLGEPLTIGRTQSCDITVTGPGVSRLHCQVVLDGEEVRLENKSSTKTGTRVNGKRVNDALALSAGDEISIGKFTLTFSTDEAGPPQEAAAAEAKGDDDFGGMTMQMDQNALAQLQREKSSRVRGYLVVTDSKGAKKNVFLEKSIFTFGKSENSDIKLGGWFCPRKCAIIFRDESGFRLLNVTPKGSDVRVNGKDIDDVRLGDNDEITVRNMKMHFMRGTPVA